MSQDRRAGSDKKMGLEEYLAEVAGRGSGVDLSRYLGKNATARNLKNVERKFQALDSQIASAIKALESTIKEAEKLHRDALDVYEDIDSLSFDKDISAGKIEGDEKELDDLLDKMIDASNEIGELASWTENAMSASKRAVYALDEAREGFEKYDPWKARDILGR